MIPRKQQLLKYSEWEQNGNWHCNDVSDVASVRSRWWVPARMLGITPAEFVQLLIEKFKPDNIKYSQEADVLIYSWSKQADCRKFKNWLNAEVRKRQYII